MAVSILSDSQPQQSGLLTLLASRHDLDAQVLSDHIKQNFSGSLLSLRQLEPFISEILRLFKRLPRNKQVNGEYATICGHRSFKKWCAGVLNRSDRTVRYMLAKAHGKAKEAKQSEEDISARIHKYLQVRLGTLSQSERVRVIAEIHEYLNGCVSEKEAA